MDEQKLGLEKTDIITEPTLDTAVLVNPIRDPILIFIMACHSSYTIFIFLATVAYKGNKKSQELINVCPGTNI